MKSLTDFQSGYVAASIDCEGTISLGRSVSRSGYLAYTARVSVGNTNINLLLFLKEITGIGVIYPAKPRKKRRKLSYEWALRIDEIKEFLPCVIPHLVIKEEQGRLLMEFIATVDGNGKSKEIDHELRNVIYHQMKELNKRGDEEQS